MSSPAVQLTFALRTSANVRTVHLVGSWDNYKSQLPLSIAKDAAKPGSWKGTFRFQGAQALKLGSRYWYYYIVDGYHVSHDPAKDHVVEKTTGRKLNVLNVPSAASNKAPQAKAAVKPSALPKTPTSPTSNRHIVQGRALSPSRIQCPRPQKPYASRGLREADYETSPVDDLEEQFAGTRISERHASASPSEISECSDSSGTLFSSSASSSSATSESEDQSSCRCNRFGITRDGRRVQLDCGGKRCGYTDSDSSDCTSDEEEDEREIALRRQAHLKAERARNGVKTTQVESRTRHAVAPRRR